MTRYLIEHSPVPQAAAAVIKNPQDRTEAIPSIFELVGGRIEHYYIAFEENTIYLLGEIPDQESLATTLRYTTLQVQDIQRQHEKFSPVTRLFSNKL